MKVSVDGVDLFEVTPIFKQILANDLIADELEADLKRRIHWVINHKLDQCFARLKQEWEPKLAARGIKSIPTNSQEFAQLVFSQEDYQDRATREKSL